MEHATTLANVDMSRLPVHVHDVDNVDNVDKKVDNVDKHVDNVDTADMNRLTM